MAKATFHRVTVEINATGATRLYSYPSITAAQASRKARAEAIADYGFLNAGPRVSLVQV